MAKKIGWVRFKMPSLTHFNVLRALDHTDGLTKDETLALLGDTPGLYLGTDHFGDMVRLGWIRTEDKSRYHITEKGRVVLGALHTISDTE